jgi:hypothetical protein
MFVLVAKIQSKKNAHSISIRSSMMNDTKDGKTSKVVVEKERLRKENSIYTGAARITSSFFDRPASEIFL